MEETRKPVDMIKLEPLSDCRQCHGKGEYAGGIRCECTMVCSCGEERPHNVTYCRHPGCDKTGCDSCCEVNWCHSEFDEANGDYFCSEHSDT